MAVNTWGSRTGQNRQNRTTKRKRKADTCQELQKPTTKKIKTKPAKHLALGSFAAPHFHHFVELRFHRREVAPRRGVAPGHDFSVGAQGGEGGAGGFHARRGGHLPRGSAVGPSFGRGRKTHGHGSKAHGGTPSEENRWPKMGGEFTSPKMVPIGFEPLLPVVLKGNQREDSNQLGGSQKLDVHVERFSNNCLWGFHLLVGVENP